MNTPERPKQPPTTNPFNSTQSPSPRPSTPTANGNPARRNKTQLASERELFGFDDIPVDVDDVPFTQIVKAWLKRGVRHSEVEQHGKRLGKLLNGRRRLGGVKNDIKWAMAADLDEEELRPTTPPPAKPHTPHQQQQARIQATPTPTNRSVDININFGELPKIPKFSPKKLIKRLKLSKKKLLLICGLIILLTCAVTAWQQFAPNEYRLPIIGKQTEKPDKASLPKEKPTYTTLTPEGVAADSWTRISPEGSAPAYSYADTIDDTRIIVTQQQLPRGVQSGDDTEFARIAASFSATEKHTEGDTVFYLGSAGGSTQHVIASKDNLLILIKAEQPLDEDEWAAYLDALK